MLPNLYKHGLRRLLPFCPHGQQRLCNIRNFPQCRDPVFQNTNNNNDDDFSTLCGFLDADSVSIFFECWQKFKHEQQYTIYAPDADCENN